MALLSALLLSLASPAAAADQPPSAASDVSARMAPFAWMVGEWQGSGWMIMPDGRRESFTSRETVTRRIGGAALLVEGLHSAADAPQRVVHNAMAMMTWDARAGAYRFRSALANGQGGDFPVTVQPDGFTWTIASPAGRIDYVVRHEGGTWVEHGTMTPPNGPARPFFEMRLTKR